MDEKVEIRNLIKIALRGQKDVLKDETDLRKEMIEFYNYILTNKHEVTRAYEEIVNRNRDLRTGIKTRKYIRLLLILLFTLLTSNYLLCIGLCFANQIITSLSTFRLDVQEAVLYATLKKINAQQDITYDELDVINTKIKSMKDKINEYESLLYYNFSLNDDVDLDIIEALETNDNTLETGLVKVLKV